MQIEKSSAVTDKVYYTISVVANELQCSTRKLPYSTWLGTIEGNGKINVWTPAATVPRGYRAAARTVLESARESLRKEGKVQ